jgi:beta-glucosidase
MTTHLPREEKALLTTGADYWSTRAVPGLGLPGIRLGDGPHGLRVQDDADHAVTPGSGGAGLRHPPGDDGPRWRAPSPPVHRGFAVDPDQGFARRGR